MAKVAIVYWSGSGNTEAMAQAVEEGAKAAGAETTLSFVSDTTASDVAAYDHIILGCPAMGNEELEEYPCLSFDQGHNNSFYFAENALQKEEKDIRNCYSRIFDALCSGPFSY